MTRAIRQVAGTRRRRATRYLTGGHNARRTSPAWCAPPRTSRAATQSMTSIAHVAMRGYRARVCPQADW